MDHVLPMPQYAPVVVVTLRQRAILERLCRSSTAEQRLVERAKIVLLSADGVLCVEQAAALGVDAQRVRRWRHRWAEVMGMLASAEAQEVDDDDLEALVLNVLRDNYRSGVPAKFAAEQLAQIIALACEEPVKFGLPVTHWTAGDLAREAKKQRIVDGISPRHIARFFGGRGDQTAPLALLAQPQDRRSGATRRRYP
jgi:putative transposase